jgi:hypothetical protein
MWTGAGWSFWGLGGAVGAARNAGKTNNFQHISTAKHTLLGENTFFQNLSRIFLQTVLGKRIEGC